MKGRALTLSELRALREKCEQITKSGWTGVSSFWAAATILDLICQVERLTTERDSFALCIARRAAEVGERRGEEP